MASETLSDTKPDEFLPLREEDHIWGCKDASLIFMEFGDYECPGCAEAYSAIRRIEEENADELCFVFRHYAYAGIHPHAEVAAQAAEAAGAQGKFWEMHDLLFENQQALVAQNEGVVLYIELPASVELVVSHTDPGLQGDRSTGGTKPATLETGAEIQVPLFLNTGDRIKVDTRDGRYLGRVNS